MLFVKSTKVRRATDRYPAGFDQSPAQPLVAKGQQLPMACLAAAGMSGGDHSGISAQFFRAGKALESLFHQAGIAISQHSLRRLFLRPLITEVVVPGFPFFAFL